MIFVIGTNIEKCSGCGACVEKCPRKCIHWKPGEFGFLYPEVDAAECIKCGLCLKVCPIGKNQDKPQEQHAYAVIHNSADTVMKSTSGGAFSAIAEYVLSLGGTVYGCAYRGHLSASHIRVASKEELRLLNGSKYVQSSTGDSFAEAKADLESGTWVLFSGTPCQIAGLHGYLGKQYDKLITVDIVCHGVPSQAYFDKYIEWYETKHDVDIEDFDFRSKENFGWSCAGTYRGTCRETSKRFVSKLNYFDSYYYFYFLSGDTYRKSCYSCDYANLNRPGDFTLGDLWGAEGMGLPFSVDNGCSLLITNTPAAESLMKSLKIRCREIPIKAAAACNAQLQKPSGLTDTRDELKRQYDECSGDEIDAYFKKKYIVNRLKGRIKYCVPKPIRTSLNKIRYRGLKNIAED